MSDFVQLVAIERGFYEGAMVEPGAKFHFATKAADGKERKLPKWAVPVAQADAALKAKNKPPQAYDTRPTAAQREARRKGAALSGAQASDIA